MQTRPLAPAQRWDTSSFDVEAYLALLGLPRAAPSAAALHSLTEAHVRAIPFENVDVVLGTHRGVGGEAVFDKLVRRGRGGYCYEHVALFAGMLERLGYAAMRVMTRRWPDRSGMRTHASVVVTVDGEPYLADVGFGGGKVSPMPLRDGAVVEQTGVPHRLRETERVWTLERRDGQEWVPEHAFGLDPAWPSDFELAHHYVSTHPRSPFVDKLVVFRTETDRLRSLIGNTLTVTPLDGSSEQRELASADVPAVLAELGIPLDQQDSAALVDTLARA